MCDSSDPDCSSVTGAFLDLASFDHHLLFYVLVQIELSILSINLF
jgi:hypothetical protein